MHRRTAIVAIGACVLAAACYRQQMADQPRCDPLAETAVFADRTCARPALPGTVAVEETTDEVDPASDDLPMPRTVELLERGRQRYDIYCAPCHDRVGTGRGMIVRRGFPQPPSYHIPRLRQAPLGYFVDVITHGTNLMPAYGARVPLADRWAIAAYIRALQRSQDAGLDDATPDARRALETARSDG